MPELIPFLRCVVSEGESLPVRVIAFKKADGKTAVAVVNKDCIYGDRRLCKVKIRETRKKTAIIILPAPMLGTEGCIAEVSKNILEWHR